MNSRLLAESGWKAILQKHKIRDNGLQRALADYEDIDEEKHDDCLEGIALVSKLAGQLKRVRDVAAKREVVDYLEEVESAAETEERNVTREKATAARTEAANQKKAESEERQRQRDEDDAEEQAAEEEEEAEGDYQTCLLRAFKKLKSMQGKTMQFIVCDARPFCGLMIAPRISSKHKEQLTEMTGGSKRFLRIGTCRADGDRYVFETEQSVQGLARKLQLSVRNFTGKKLQIVIGDESSDNEEDDNSEAPESREA